MDLMLLNQVGFDVLLASHAYKHPFVGSTLLGSVYEVVPNPASSFQEVQ
jgi:hypothetical protein